MDFKDKIDVCILCGARQGTYQSRPLITEHFNTVDSFDTMLRYRSTSRGVDEVAKASGKSIGDFSGLGPWPL